MLQHPTPPKVRPTEWWQKVARRIRVPLGFVTAAVFLVEVTRSASHMAAIAWSLVLVVPGLALRAAASGTVKKNRELTVTGPYAYTRNPLYLGSALIAAGFALALLNWPVALLVLGGFAAIYIPVIAAEERFLGDTFARFADYRRHVPRFLPRLTAYKAQNGEDLADVSQAVTSASVEGFSLALYRKHREYNAAIGAALLYLSLLYLRPALEFLLHRVR
jgi:protein-S-isoprenylcysteine O-methyltransferase Ste14